MAKELTNEQLKSFITLERLQQTTSRVKVEIDAVKTIANNAKTIADTNTVNITTATDLANTAKTTADDALALAQEAKTAAESNAGAAEALALAQEAKTTATEAKGLATSSIKSVNITGNTITFYTSDDKSGTPVASIDIAASEFLSKIETKFVPSFHFSTELYGEDTLDPSQEEVYDETDPNNPVLIQPAINYEGHPVLVIAIEDTDGGKTYSFADLTTLLDEYTIAADSENILSISENAISLHISQDAGNILEVKNDGLYVSDAQTIKLVENATNDNLAALNADGSVKDAGIAKSDLLLKSADVATVEEVTNMLDEVFE